MDDIIPRGVKYLKLGGDILLNENTLPHGLTHLIFDYKFNSKINGFIPETVTHLEFGINFNQPLKIDDIPSNVVHLKFGADFNQPITEKIIPHFGICYTHFCKAKMNIHTQNV
ncbi:FNIp repeat-containing protein [Saudi moumouvirus]|nr:FNIp repeat-containing protein [Saudi moumouvirus]